MGLGKREYLYDELGEGTVELMKTIKRTIDPLNLFNPGKVRVCLTRDNTVSDGAGRGCGTHSCIPIDLRRMQSSMRVRGPLGPVDRMLLPSSIPLYTLY